MVMKPILLFMIISLVGQAQIYQDAESVLGRLDTSGSLPEKILSTRSAVLYSPNVTLKEVNDIHESLVQTGIDAVAYFETDRVFAGPDVELGFIQYFKAREIENLVLVEKKAESFRVMATTFGGADGVIRVTQAVWQSQERTLKDALRVLYSTALNTFKKQNMLINDVAEVDLIVNVIAGRRTEAFASDLKVDKLAVRKFGDELLDKELEDIMANYPFKYALVDNSIAEPDLRRQGYFYILRFLHSRGPVAKQLLGYETSQAETAVVSITFPNGLEQVKTIPSDRPIYKFYFRQIEFNNVFLGTKWDADLTWQQALQNFISGFRKEMRVN
jgi:hypothetical protein